MFKPGTYVEVLENAHLAKKSLIVIFKQASGSQLSNHLKKKQPAQDPIDKRSRVTPVTARPSSGTVTPFGPICKHF